MLNSVAQLALAPVLLAQGMRVRRSALRLPEADGERAGEHAAIDAAPSLGLLIAGDSAAAGVGAATQRQALAGHLVEALSSRSGRSVRWRVVARTGDTAIDLLAHLREASAQPFEMAVVSIGVNDVTGGTRIKAWLRTLGEISNLLQTRFDARRIVFSGLPPVGKFPLLPQPLRWVLGTRALAFDAALHAWAPTHPNTTSVRVNLQAKAHDMAADGFHPGPRIYERWAQALAPALLNPDSVALPG